jgi:hypothetical protein
MRHRFPIQFSGQDRPVQQRVSTVEARPDRLSASRVLAEDVHAYTSMVTSNCPGIPEKRRRIRVTRRGRELLAGDLRCFVPSSASFRRASRRRSSPVLERTALPQFRRALARYQSSQNPVLAFSNRGVDNCNTPA